jgi:hypothetical protein
MNEPYVVCFVPTRGDRPRMLKACIEMMKHQTLLPVEVMLINQPPLDPSKKDITWRYRTGLDLVKERHPNAELVIFIEDDDWYSPSYIEIFYDAWNKADRPEIFGVGETYYYHIQSRLIYHEKHPKRASAFCTGVSLKILEKMNWPSDDYSFVDIEMWSQLSGNTFMVDPPIAIGMKGHREGNFFGGAGHNDNLRGYNKQDKNLAWISSMINGKYSMDMLSFYFGNVSPRGVHGPLGPEKTSFT